MQKSFILYNDSLDVLDELNDEQAGKLFKAIRNYQKGCDLQIEGLIKVVFIPFKNQLDRDREKYESICEAKRNAGIKSGESRRKKSNRTKRTHVHSVEQKRTPVHSVEQTRTKRTYTDNVNKNDNDNKEIQEVFVSELEKTIKDFKEFRKSIKKPMTDLAVELLRKKLQKFAAAESDQVQILEQSIVNGWQGVFELKVEKKKELSENMKAMLMIKAKEAQGQERVIIGMDKYLPHKQ